MSGVDLLGGLFHADSVVTDLVAVSDGKTAASDGRTTVNGLTFLGLEATVDRHGLHLAERPPGPDRPRVRSTRCSAPSSARPRCRRARPTRSSRCRRACGTPSVADGLAPCRLCDPYG